MLGFSFVALRAGGFRPPFTAVYRIPHLPAKLAAFPQQWEL
jgi:hypothetical protein